MAPIADTPNDLHTTRPVRWSRVISVIRIIFLSAPLWAEETLFEVATHLMPLLAVRMTYDRLVGSGADIVWKGEPIKAT